MDLIVLGLNHATAPLAIRERFAVSSANLSSVFRELRGFLPESFVLSTCHRVEIHAVGDRDAVDSLRTWLAARGGIGIGELRRHSYEHRQLGAVRHAFRVATGLDSVVLGEQQILEQYRRAVDAARQLGGLGPLLERLETGALACGKKARSSTGIARHGASLVGLTVRSAMAEAGLSPTDVRVLVLGAGKAAGLALDELALLGATRVTVVNRTYDRARELAEQHGAEARPWDGLRTALAQTDVVIGCTSAKAPVLDPETVGAGRGSQPLLCIDVGVPRDIDLRVGALPGVRRVGLEQVRSAAGGPDQDREIAAAERIVAEEADRYQHWWRVRRVAPAIARLRSHGEAIRDREVERALARLQDLDPAERAVVRSLAERITAKLLHPPTVALKADHDDPHLALALERLYQSVPE